MQKSIVILLEPFLKSLFILYLAAEPTCCLLFLELDFELKIVWKELVLLSNVQLACPFLSLLLASFVLILNVLGAHDVIDALLQGPATTS